MSIGVIAIWASLAGAKWKGEAIPKMHAELPEAASCSIYVISLLVREVRRNGTASPVTSPVAI
jgi:hypothetical protein